MGLVSQNENHAGRLLGTDNSAAGSLKLDYWDTTTRGIDDGVKGGNESGVTGMTTQQLQSGLPKGFSAKVWGENPNIKRPAVPGQQSAAQIVARLTITSQFAVLSGPVRREA
jgi:hypothetical protein